jgi:hypothetical protein
VPAFLAEVHSHQTLRSARCSVLLTVLGTALLLLLLLMPQGGQGPLVGCVVLLLLLLGVMPQLLKYLGGWEYLHCGP